MPSTKTPNLPTVRQEVNFDETMKLATVLAQSGYFSDARGAAQAVVKILAGAELGFGPIASMSDIHIIEGKPRTGAHLLAAAIRGSGKYDYKVLQDSREVCELEFVRLNGKDKEVLGTIKETLADAIKYGLNRTSKGTKSTYDKHSDDMLFARAIGKGFRRHCPDLTRGLLIYVDGETDDREPDQEAIPASKPDGEIIDAEYQVVPEKKPEEPQTLQEAMHTASGIDQASVAELQGLIADTQTNLTKLKQHYAVTNLADLSPAQFQEVRQILLDRKAEKTKPEPTVNGRTTSVVQLAIDQLTIDLQISEQDWKKRLKRDYGKTDAFKLTADQLLDLEAKLTKEKEALQPS